MLWMRYPGSSTQHNFLVDALLWQLHKTSQVTSWSKTATVNKRRIHHVIPVQNTRKSLGYLDHFYLRGPPPRNFQILNPKLKVGISWNNIHVFPFHRERGTEGYPRRSKTLNPKLKISQFRLKATWMQDDFQSSSDSTESLLFQQSAFQKPFISFNLSLKRLRLIFTTPIKGLHNSQRSCLDWDGLEYGSWSNACDTGPDSNTHW